MADEITFVIDGAAERGGAVPAAAFLSRLRSFISVLYAFDRAFAHRDKRSIDLEIVTMSRSSPARVGMRIRTKVPGYPADEAMEWTFRQLDQIQSGGTPDESVPLAVIDNVIDLATYRQGKLPDVSKIQVVYKSVEVEVDDRLANRAMAIRAIAAVDESNPWYSGISRGEIFGELRGTVDFDGEREFYISPPSGPSKILCIFPEELRTKVRESLWRPVKASGFLHYNGKGPFPHLLEADAIGEVVQPEGHFSEMRGAFKAYAPAHRVEWQDE